MASEEQIRGLAYSIWEKEGRPAGEDVKHYYQAKVMLEEQEAASPTANGPALPASELQPPPAPKPAIRHTGKRRSKKA